MIMFARLQGYALAAMDTNTLSIVYPGVSKTARNQRVSSSLISKLKEGATPIITDVRSNNTSSMVERFEHFGFVKGDVNVDRTKLRWENGPRLKGVKSDETQREQRSADSGQHYADVSRRRRTRSSSRSIRRPYR